MEIKVIPVGVSEGKALLKVIGGNSKRGYQSIIRTNDPLQAVNRSLNSYSSSIKVGDYFKAKCDIDKYFNLKYAFKYQNGIYKYYKNVNACASA